MGTEWMVVAILPDGMDGDDICNAAEPVFDLIIADLSPWAPEAFISQFNAAAPGTVLHAPEDFRIVLAASADIAEKSAGAFNPLHRCMPNGPKVGACLKAIQRDDALIQSGGVMLDLSAAAKGYAVDCLSEALQQIGVPSFLAEIGGEFVGHGLKPDGTPWWIDLEPPTAASGRWRVALSTGALATSGMYHDEGHLRLGENGGDDIRPLASVSVLAENCMLADAWATALYVSGARHLELADAHGVAAVFQYADGSSSGSAALELYLD